MRARTTFSADNVAIVADAGARSVWSPWWNELLLLVVKVCGLPHRVLGRWFEAHQEKPPSSLDQVCAVYYWVGGSRICAMNPPSSIHGAIVDRCAAYCEADGPSIDETTFRDSCWFGSEEMGWHKVHILIRREADKPSRAFLEFGETLPAGRQLEPHGYT